MSAIGGAAPAGPSPVNGSRHRRVFLAVLIALIALAWLALWAWVRSPYGRYLEHDDRTATGPAGPWIIRARI